jgi:hypothetical protein
MRWFSALLLACLAATGCQSANRPHTTAKPTLPSPWQTIQKAEAAEAAANLDQ